MLGELVTGEVEECELREIYITGKEGEYNIETQKLYSDDFYEGEERIKMFVSQEVIDIVEGLSYENIGENINLIAEQLLERRELTLKKVQQLLQIPYMKTAA